MIKTSVLIVNQLGLHARASAKLVSTITRFQSRISITKGDRTIDGKSIMAVMTLAATQGTTLILSIDGPDEQEMTEKVVALIEGKFGESA